MVPLTWILFPIKIFSLFVLMFSQQKMNRRRGSFKQLINDVASMDDYIDYAAINHHVIYLHILVNKMRTAKKISRKESNVRPSHTKLHIHWNMRLRAQQILVTTTLTFCTSRIRINLTRSLTTIAKLNLNYSNIYQKVIVKEIYTLICLKTNFFNWIIFFFWHCKCRWILRQ